MDAILSHEDSLKLLRVARTSPELELVAPRRPPLPSAGTTDFALLGAALPPEIARPSREHPVHLTFFSREARCKSVRARSTSVLGELPEGAFLEVVRADGTPLAEGAGERAHLFVESPGLCLVRMAHLMERRVNASSLTLNAALVRLAGLGMELCGTYARDPCDPGRGMSTFGLPPVAPAGEVARFLSGAPRMRGLALARRAATFVRDGSGSPHETLLSLAYRLAPSLGGAELAEPRANETIEWPDDALPLLKHRTMRPDFYWPQYRTASEYLGGVHGRDGAYVEDSNRIQDYQSCRLTVFPATYEDIRSSRALGSYIMRIVRAMARYEGEGWARRKEAALLDPEACQARGVLIAHLLPPWA